MLRTEVLDGPDGFARLEASWKALVAESPTATPFQTFEWQSIWWRHYGSGKRPRFFAFYEGHDLVGLYPAVRGPGLWRTLRPMGIGPSDYLHPLARGETEGAVAAALAGVLTETEDVDLFDLHQVRESQPLAATADVPPIDQATCLVLDLPDTYDAYLATLGKSLRYDVRKLDKTLFTGGRATIQAFGPDDAQEGLEAFYALHNLRWKARGQWWGGAFVGRSVPFHREWVEVAAANGWLRLRLLRVDGVPAGAIYGMTLGSTTYFYQSGFDPAQKAISPGTLLVAYTIRQAIEEGQRHFDFMRGDEPYKRRWKPQHVLANRRLLLPTKPGRGRWGEGWNRWASGVEARVRARLEGKGL